MHTVQTARHLDDIDLTWEQVHQALRALTGSRVAVRVIERGDPEMLLTVFIGTLGALGHAKHPALFWPVSLDVPPLRRPLRFTSNATATTSRMSASTCVAIASRGPWGALDAPCWRSSRVPCSSTSVARRLRLPAPAQASEGHELLIEPCAPFRLDLTAWALRRRAHNAVDRWDGSTYQRVVAVDGGPVALSVTQDDALGAPRLSVLLTGRPIDQPAELSRARRWNGSSG